MYMYIAGTLLVMLTIIFFTPGSDSRACTGISLHSCKGLIAVISNSYVTSRYSTR